MIMNKKGYMWARLIAPVITIIIWIVSNDPIYLAFAAGYLVCWGFSWNLIDDVKGEVAE